MRRPASVRVHWYVMSKLSGNEHPIVPAAQPGRASNASAAPPTRGLHSSTVRLNLSAFCGLGVALRGCLRGVYGVLGAIRTWLGCILCQKRLRLI